MAEHLTLDQGVGGSSPPPPASVTRCPTRAPRSLRPAGTDAGTSTSALVPGADIGATVRERGEVKGLSDKELPKGLGQRAEVIFEHYLADRGIPFDYELEAAGKHPDFWLDTPAGVVV